MAQHTQSKERTFWKFLQENSIEIPIIQRDYAQGRIGKEYLRKTFIESLKAALDNNNNNQKLKLDFVYGTLENGKIYPLDGQQRLTTLWLLHWYIALRSGNLNEANCNILKNFTYETRISSRDFCEQLCNVKNWDHYPHSGNIAKYIKDQHWFSSAWLQDPTISSMLNMLAGTKPADDREDIMDGIEEAFTCSQIGNISTKSCAASEYWNKLTSDNCPIIFYYLPITDMGLTDDLYIKMNARGKQLSNFENLKADLIGYVQKQCSELERGNWGKFLNVSDKDNYLPLLLDTTWTGLFWEKRFDNKEQPCKIDEIFFAFINRFFWNELVLQHVEKGGKKKLEDNKSYKYFNNSEDTKNFDMTIAYHGLSVYKYDHDNIPFELFERLIKILGNYIELLDDQLDDILFCRFENDQRNQFYFIPRYQNNLIGDEKDKAATDIFDNDGNEISPITHLTQVQRIVYSAVCKFFYSLKEEQIRNKEKCKTALKQWMRVVWNLVSGLDEKGRPQIRTIDAMLNAIKFINSDKLNCLDVYTSLQNLDNIGNVDFKESNFSGWNFNLLDNNFNARCLEECLKAKLISDDSGWKSEFIDKEPKYRGSIRFLLLDANGDPTNMDTFKSKANKNILEDENFYTNLIKHCTELNQLKEIVYASSDNAKITNLLNPKLLEPIHNMLMDKEPNGNDSIKDLREALKNATEKINAKEIYRLREKETGYYFEVPYKRDQEEGLIFPK